MRQVLAIVGRGVVAWDEPITYGDDLGSTRGDGCFEATLVERLDDQLKVHNLTEHLERLARSASRLAITIPDEDAWCETVREATEAWSGDYGVIKIVVTRGHEFAPGAATAFLTVTDVTSATQMDRSGVRLACLNRGYPADVFADAPWLLGGVKTISYAVNMAAKREATARGANDVLFISADGYALEGPTAGLIWRIGDDLFSTPTGDTGILDSITVGKVFAGAQAEGISCTRQLIHIDDLKKVDAAWLMSSVRGVSPIKALDDTDMVVDDEMTARMRVWAGFDH